MLQTLRVVVLALIASTTLVTHSLIAADAGPAPAPAPVAGPNLKTHPLAGKVDHRLLPQVLAVRGKTSTDAQAAKAITAVHSRAVTAAGDATQLGVSIDTIVTADTLKQIAATGATIISSAPQWNSVCVMATASQISALADLGVVNQIKLQSKPHRRQQQGVKPDEADSVMHTDIVRNTDGKTGAGQTVGVISDSVNDTAKVGGTRNGSVPNATVTNSLPQTDAGTGGTHDLPASFKVVNFGPGGGTDEGEAMMEEIHDIAPNAALAFGSCGNDQPTMATTLGQLRTVANCTVTVDDIGFADEPFFQDGPIAQAIASNRAAGVPHFSAFGNDGNQGILTTYKSIGAPSDNFAFPPDGSCFHDWGNGIGAFLPVKIPKNASVTIILQWDQPFSRFGLGAGSNADLDMYLCSTGVLADFIAGTSIAGSSFDSQGTASNPAGDPEEFIDYQNTSGADQTYYLVINHYHGSRISSTGSGGNVMRIVFDDDGFGTLPTVTPVGGNQMTSYGHPTSPAAIGVGAVDWQNPGRPEFFTSKGGNLPFYFTTTGSPSATTRFGPDLCAPDGVSCSNSNFQPFFGTSCAAPNAAATAALLLEAQSMTPSQLLALMTATATDITSPPVAPSTDTSISMNGNDPYTGAGLVCADRAYDSSKPVILSPLSVNTFVGSQFNYTLLGSGMGTLTYFINAAEVPSPLTINGTQIITGIPVLANQGSFQVHVSVSNSFGTTPAIVTVNVGPPVPVNVTGVFAAANPTILGNPTTFTFSATGSNRGFSSVTWDFGDTSGGTGSPVQHTYPALGNYTATVTVTDNNGQSNTGSVTFPVIPPPIVIGQVPTATPNPTFTTIPIQFSAAASGGIAPLTFAWNFGDGATSTALAPSHTYTTAGTYSVSFTVSDAAAQSKKLTVSVQVAAYTTISFPSAPTASPAVAGTGQLVSFTSTAAGNGTLTTAWNFGDGSTATGLNVSHVYLTPGQYTVTVTITDITAQTTSKTLSIHVNAPLIGTGLDSDGDGVSDAVELLAGTNPNDATSSPVSNPSAAPGTLAITKCGVKLNFARQENDSITISGTLAISAGAQLNGTRLIYNVGGAQDGLTLDGKGRSNAGTSEKFTVTVKSVKGVVAAQTAKFSLTLSHSTFSTMLADFGFVNGNAANVPLTLPIQFIFNGTILQAQKALTYTAKAGKTGSAK